MNVNHDFYKKRNNIKRIAQVLTGLEVELSQFPSFCRGEKGESARYGFDVGVFLGVLTRPNVKSLQSMVIVSAMARAQRSRYGRLFG